MSWWSALWRRQRAQPRSDRLPKRAWAAAKNTLLSSDWPMFGQPINSDIRHHLRVLRARSREQAQNNDHVRHFLRLTNNNVVGDQGVQFQARVKNRRGKPDTKVNAAIELAWKDWGVYGSPDVTGTLSWRGIQSHFIETAARDGEAIFRRLNGWQDNRYQFALQAIDPETLDVELNRDLSNGHRIVMGVEIDAFRRPRAYHLIPERQATSLTGASASARDHVRVPAEEVYHCFLPEWVWQTRGVPWTATALLRLKLLAGYEDAEITAARIAAAKMGFYKPNEDAVGYTPDEKTDEGHFVNNASPGEFEVLPVGYEFQGWDPQHPNAGYGAFVKSILRSIASGLGVNYNTLANDLEGVNFTSLRHGMLIEREVWMCLQAWMIECFCNRVYRDWLRMSLLAGAITVSGRPLSAERQVDFRHVQWQARRWQWVDPLKEVKADREAYDMRTTSLSGIIRASGRDPEEVWLEIKGDHDKLAELGISVPTATGAAVNADAEDDDEKENQQEAEDGGSEKDSA